MYKPSAYCDFLPRFSYKILFEVISDTVDWF